MTSTPTPAEFLTRADFDDHEDLVEFERETLTTWSADPLESIANSLRRLVAYTTGAEAAAQADGAEQCEHAEDLADTLQQLDDLEAKHQALFGLLADVEKLVAPSTSKLANGVREAITRWRNPVVPEIPDARPDTPAPDADVEEWRSYAIAQGIPSDVVHDLNRSQIRTALGIEQPAGEVRGDL